MLMKGVRSSLWKLLRGITLKGGQFSDGYILAGGTLCNGPYEDAPPERGACFRLPRYLRGVGMGFQLLSI